MGHEWRCAVIPAPPGLVARFRQGESRIFSSKPVIAFDDDGYPLVLHEKYHYLIRPDSYSNFVSVVDDPHPPVVALLPSGGWRIEWTNKGEAPWSEPLVGWGLRQDGAVVALDTDSDGLVMERDSDFPNTTFRIYHPEQDPAPETGKEGDDHGGDQS